MLSWLLNYFHQLELILTLAILEAFIYILIFIISFEDKLFLAQAHETVHHNTITCGCYLLPFFFFFFVGNKGIVSWLSTQAHQRSFPSGKYEEKVTESDERLRQTLICAQISFIFYHCIVLCSRVI